MSSQEVPGRLNLGGGLCCSPALQPPPDPTDVEVTPLRLRADGGRATTGALAEQVRLTQPTVTHHLGALFDAGFLERERDGRQTWYWVDTDALQAIRQLLDPAPARQLLTIEPRK